MKQFLATVVVILVFFGTSQSQVSISVKAAEVLNSSTFSIENKDGETFLVSNHRDSFALHNDATLYFTNSKNLEVVDDSIIYRCATGMLYKYDYHASAEPGWFIWGGSRGVWFISSDDKEAWEDNFYMTGSHSCNLFQDSLIHKNSYLMDMHLDDTLVLKGQAIYFEDGGIKIEDLTNKDCYTRPWVISSQKKVNQKESLFSENPINKIFFSEKSKRAIFDMGYKIFDDGKTVSIHCSDGKMVAHTSKALVYTQGLEFGYSTVIIHSMDSVRYLISKDTLIRRDYRGERRAIHSWNSEKGQWKKEIPKFGDNNHSWGYYGTDFERLSGSDENASKLLEWTSILFDMSKEDQMEIGDYVIFPIGWRFNYGGKIEVISPSGGANLFKN